MGNESHRNASSTVSETVVGRLTLNQTPAEVKAGDTRLAGRSKFFLINDSSDLIYLNTDPNFTIADANIVAFSGEAIVFDVNSNPEDKDPFVIYAIIEEGTNTCRVLEVR